MYRRLDVGLLPDLRQRRGDAAGALLSPLLLVFCTGCWPVPGWRLMAALLFLLCLFRLGICGRMPLPPENPERSLKAVDYSFLKVKQFWLSAGKKGAAA